MTQYYSNTKDELININDMPHQHVWYAFKKLCDRLEQLHICKDVWEDMQFSPKATSNTIFKLEERVSELLLENKHLRNRIQNVYAEHYHPSPRYHLHEIPNDEHGESMIKWFKNYLNTDRYTIRVRGQHLDNTKLGKNETWRDYEYGQPINKSSHLRVYIDQKKARK